MTYPNLAGVITKDDVHSKGTGSYAASYVAWARIANHLHTHAPGWEFHLKPNHQIVITSGKRQMVPATSIGYFTGPDDQATADFPFPVMDNPEQCHYKFDKISARALTDAHRRALCACAAYTLSLGYELWAKEEVAEAGAVHLQQWLSVAPAEAKAKPVTQSQAKSQCSRAPIQRQASSQSASKTCQSPRKNTTLVIELLSEVHQNSPEKIVDLTKAFRKQYDLDSKAALSKEIKTQGQVEFINVFLSS
jgi:hypothetical protein